jgi:hypothetical protein
MTTMDLWYDLAIRERPDPAPYVIDPCELEDAEEQPKQAPEAPASA